tara:strand:- start:553 stop:1179 length:627 start_codon:yes stop_codon:yes gene_type:complete
MKSKIKVVKEVVSINTLKELGKNPRRISDRKLKQLSKSVSDFEKMLDVREIVVDENDVIIGGNQRYKALLENKVNDVTILRVTGLTEDNKDEFVIKDNVTYGVWDWDVLANHHDAQMLKEYGLNVWQPSEEDEHDDVSQSITYESGSALEDLDGAFEEEEDDVKDSVVVIDFYSQDYDSAKILLQERVNQGHNISELLYKYLKEVCND